MNLLTPLSFAATHEGPKAIVVDRLPKSGIKVERRVVGDASQVDYGVAPGQGVRDLVGIAQVGPNLDEARNPDA